MPVLCSLAPICGGCAPRSPTSRLSPPGLISMSPCCRLRPRERYRAVYAQRLLPDAASAGKAPSPAPPFLSLAWATCAARSHDNSGELHQRVLSVALWSVVRVALQATSWKATPLLFSFQPGLHAQFARTSLFGATGAVSPAREADLCVRAVFPVMFC